MVLSPSQHRRCLLTDDVAERYVLLVKVLLDLKDIFRCHLRFCSELFSQVYLPPCLLHHPVLSFIPFRFPTLSRLLQISMTPSYPSLLLLSLVLSACMELLPGSHICALSPLESLSIGKQEQSPNLSGSPSISIPSETNFTPLT